MRFCSSDVMCRPNSSTLPSSGAVMPTIMRMVVVFPAPLGPMRPKMRPGLTERLSPSTAVKSPKRFVTRSSLRVGFCSLKISRLAGRGAMS